MSPITPRPVSRRISRSISNLRTARSAAERSLLPNNTTSQLKEMRRPLRECGLTKSDIRWLSKAAGLFPWNKPAYPCLATRFKNSPLPFPPCSTSAPGYRPALGFFDFRVRMKGNRAFVQMETVQYLWAAEKRNKIKGGLSPLFENSIMLEPDTRKEEKTGMETMEILQAVQAGTMTPQEAMLKLKMQPFEGNIGFAKIDHHRALRQGAQEVVYGASKTPDQILKIAQAMDAYGYKNILITRMKPEAAELVGKSLDLFYDPLSKIGIVNREFKDTGNGYIAVVSGGTGDQPVSEEAALTAEALGNRVERVYDVGVSGLHRLFAKLDVIMGARAIIAVAGMEGALPSVVGGLVDVPVIAVPTSVGYGASLGGISALLNMLNSCASGVSVVNIDNGFGAGFIAGRINHMEGSK